MSILKRIPPGHLGFDGVNVYEPGWHFLAGPVRLFSTEPEEKTLDFMVPLPDGSAVVVGAGAVWTIWRDTLHLLPVVADESKLIHPILHRRLIDAARVLPGRPEALAGHEHFERAMKSADLTPVGLYLVEAIVCDVIPKRDPVAPRPPERNVHAELDASYNAFVEVIDAKKKYQRKADTLDDEDEREAAHAFVDNLAEKERRRLLGLRP